MICIDCKERETKTPGMRWCNRCSARKFRRENPLKYRGYFYNGRAKEVYERDENTCQICGYSEEKKQERRSKLEIHHIDGKGSSLPLSEQNNHLDNLVLVCKKCHVNITKQEVRLGRSLGYDQLNGRWSMEYDKCIECQKTTSHHQGKGLCLRCYEAKRKIYKRIKQREYEAKWRARREQASKELLISPLLYPKQ